MMGNMPQAQAPKKEDRAAKKEKYKRMQEEYAELAQNLPEGE